MGGAKCDSRFMPRLPTKNEQTGMSVPLKSEVGQTFLSVRFEEELRPASIPSTRRVDHCCRRGIRPWLRHGQASTGRGWSSACQSRISCDVRCRSSHLPDQPSVAGRRDCGGSRRRSRCRRRSSCCPAASPLPSGSLSSGQGCRQTARCGSD